MMDPLLLLGSRSDPNFKQFSGNVLDSVEAVCGAYAQHTCARWVVPDPRSVSLLAGTTQAHDRWHRVLLLKRVDWARRELLHVHFRVVVAPDDRVRLLPHNELIEVVTSDQAQDLFLGGVVDHDDAVVVLYRGDLDRIVVPFAWFTTTDNGTQPNFEAFSITDFGQTIQLGDYEAAADAVLYEFDSDARGRMKARAIEKDSSFGGALRRLRLSRRLSRSDFQPLSEKTIARIERGDVEEPREETLQIIADRLGVNAAKIKDY